MEASNEGNGVGDGDTAEKEEPRRVMCLFMGSRG